MIFHDTRNLIRANAIAVTPIGAAIMPNYSIGCALFTDPRTGEETTAIVRNNAPRLFREGSAFDIVLVPRDGWFVDTTPTFAPAKPGQVKPPVGCRVPFFDPALETAGVG